MTKRMPGLRLVDRLKELGRVLGIRPLVVPQFTKIEWDGTMFVAHGKYRTRPLTVLLNLNGFDQQITSACSICNSLTFCPHAVGLVGMLNDNGIARDIESRGLASAVYEPSPKKAPPIDPWKSQLTNLAQRFDFYTPAPPAPASFPAGRQAIYVLHPPIRYSTPSGKLEVVVATRPLAPPQVSHSGKSTYSNSIYRNLSAGVNALAASGDPLDREIADRLSITTFESPYESRQQLRLSLSPESSRDLISRIARSGRLFWNSEDMLHDDLIPLSWIGDEKFELKFHVAAVDETSISLSTCVACAGTIIPQNQLRVIAPAFMIDRENRLGLFERSIPHQVLEALRSSSTIVVPRAHAGELIEKLMGTRAGLAIEFTDCDDVRPQRVTCIPRPAIHIKAPAHQSERLEATVHFDYDGTRIPLESRLSEVYDKTRGVIIPVDRAIHERSEELLRSLGIKKHERYNSFGLSILKSKLPRIVGQLIHEGWHVEADGKLYRTGARFDVSVVSGIDWFELQGKAHFDQTAIDLPKLLQAMRSGETSVVLDDGSVGLIPQAWLKQFGGLAELASSDDGSLKFGRSQLGLLDALLAEQSACNVDEVFAAARQGLRDFDKVAPLDAPEGFVGTLRPYQKLAQGWFEFLRNLGFGGCLADDMGLGKTIQVLALLELRRQTSAGPSLIVVPRSLIFNWIAEAGKFAPQLRVLDQSHSQRARGTEHLRDFDLVLTTYGTLRRDAVFLKDFEFDYVVLDEAQAIKNATTEASKAARLLRGRHKLALSGTPIENHLGELWSLFDFLNPGMLGRVGRFARLAEDADGDQRKLLASAVRPFILRRTKKEVAPELPDRIEQTVIVQLDPDQRTAYDELRDYYRLALMKKIETDGIRKSQIVILEALLRLRQAACHPGLVDKKLASKSSAKLEELVLRVQSATSSGERVLVFSQFTSFLAIVKTRLREENINFLYLDGKTKDRQALVNQFQSATGPAVFLISLKAGGVGLNLTAARSVYLLDPWWNPAVEAQAIDRSHRIGQQHAVFATRLIAADTVEQKVLELQAKKKGLADAIINADNAGISSLTRDDLELLLA